MRDLKEGVMIHQSPGLRKNSEFRRLFNHRLLKALSSGVTREVRKNGNFLPNFFAIFNAMSVLRSSTAGW